MDREYLEDYEQNEKSEAERLIDRKILEGKFSFEEDRYPPDERFKNIQKPIAIADTTQPIWAQVPFSGSVILFLHPFKKSDCDEFCFKVSEIPKMIDFIKETGRLQVVLTMNPTEFEGLDYLDPFFKELKPPMYAGTPYFILGNEKQIKTAENTFYAVGNVRYINFLRKATRQNIFETALAKSLHVYLPLKLAGHTTAVTEIENMMIDDPEKAFFLIQLYERFISSPLMDLRCNLRNISFEMLRGAQLLPLVYQPQEIRFPCEIGKFLLKKLTYAPQGLRACNELIDHYDAYDLMKIQESFNEAIVRNHPDILSKNAEELSEILDNVWKDKTIPRRIKGLEIGMPLSIAAIGGVAAGPIGAATGGFLAELGFRVADKILDLNTTGLSERLAKLKTKSYQANVYDFKKKYKHRIMPT